MNISHEERDERITSKDLIDLGFVREDVTAEESGDEDFSYYFLHVDKGFGLISDEGEDGYFTVDVFNTEFPIRFKFLPALKQLIKLIKSHYAKNT